MGFTGKVPPPYVVGYDCGDIFHRLRNSRPGATPASAFTMVEIAICLAVIAFALVAIIGVLPIGMNVQKDNREETIVGQDASVFINAIRTGARGMNDLTNYVVAITNYWNEFSPNMVRMSSNYDGYTLYSSHVTSLPGVPSNFGLTDGKIVVGLLSTPRFTTQAGSGNIISNHVVAYVRSLSGPAADKYPQGDSNILDLAFSYRLESDLAPVAVPVETNNPAALWLAYNYATNLHDLQLTFRWPLLPGGGVGRGAQTFRTQVSGIIEQTYTNNQALYFVDPRTFAAARPY